MSVFKNYFYAWDCLLHHCNLLTLHKQWKCILLASLFMVSLDSVAVSNRVIAVVNNEVITEKELDARLTRIKTRPSATEAERYGQLKTAEELRYQVLKALVEESVLIQRARQLGLKVSPSEVDATMTSLYQSMGLNPALEADQSAIGFLRQEVESELLVSRLVQATLARRINVSAFEVDEILSQQANNGSSKEYQTVQLFVKVEENETDERRQQIRQKVEDWRQALLGGMTMEALVSANSESPVAPILRNLGWKNSRQLPELFLSQLDVMKNGQISEVIASPQAFHILQLRDVRGGAKLVEKRLAQHILIRAKTDFERQQAVEKMIAVRDEIIAGGRFDEFATQLSDDAGSAAKGGDLGWVSLGETVPEFEKALFSLNEGELSQPINTAFGVHLLKLNKVAQEDVSNEARREQIAEQIRRRKIAQHYSAWLSDLVSKAYIDYF